MKLIHNSNGNKNVFGIKMNSCYCWFTLAENKNITMYCMNVLKWNEQTRFQCIVIFNGNNLMCLFIDEPNVEQTTINGCKLQLNDWFDKTITR